MMLCPEVPYAVEPSGPTAVGEQMAEVLIQLLNARWSRRE